MEEKTKLVEDILELLREQKKALEELVQEGSYEVISYIRVAHDINKKIGYKVNEL